MDVMFTYPIFPKELGYAKSGVIMHETKPGRKVHVGGSVPSWKTI